MVPPDSQRPRNTSVDLLRLARTGDRDALNQLFSREFLPLKRWASGRLPRWARSIAETTDLVQDVMLTAFRRLDAIEYRRRGALQAYLRQSIHNRIRDELRSLAVRPAVSALDVEAEAREPSPLAAAIDNEAQERYKRAVARLRSSDQELIIGRLELGYSYEQLAMATQRRSAEATRKAVARAVQALVKEMSAAGVVCSDQHDQGR